MPNIQFSDNEIDTLIAAPKHLPTDYRRRLSNPRARAYSAQHEEAQLEVSLETDETFRIILRKSRINPLDFSVILGYMPRERLKIFRLRRYNGFYANQHTNKLEGNSFRGFHIHYATERYQVAGWDEDGYAQETDRYSTIDGALEALLGDCHFIRPDQERLQARMF